MKERGKDEYSSIDEKATPYLYTDCYHKICRVLRFIGKSFFPVYASYPYISFKLSESEKETIRDDTAHFYVSISINRDNFREPVKIERTDFYNKLVSYLDKTFGYKTGRVMSIIQFLGPLKEDSEPLTNTSPEYPNIAFVVAQYYDTSEYRKWYQKYGKDLSVEEIISKYPILRWF